jgi:ParB-like chromosome segregation protein Spo0J
MAIVKENEFSLVPITILRKAEWNYKKNNPDLLEKLKSNIVKNKQIENIIIRELEDETYEVVNGNHRVDAFVELGIENVMAFNLGKISKEQAQRIAIETNETKFESDTLKLAEIFKELLKTTDIADLEKSMPYSEQEIENMAKLTDFDWDAFNDKDDTAAKRIRYEISVDDCDAMIEQELSDVVTKYATAKLRTL